MVNNNILIPPKFKIHSGSSPDTELEDRILRDRDVRKGALFSLKFRHVLNERSDATMVGMLRVELEEKQAANRAKYLVAA